MDPWATPDQAKQFWDDAADVPDAALTILLSVATTQAAAYAPALAEAAPVPDNYMLATVYQARELWAAASRDGDAIGVGDFVIRARPLTGAVKQLLRPAGYSLFVG